MENLNDKIRKGFNIKLDSELNNELDRRSYWDYKTLIRNQLRNQLESQLFWILDERLGEQLKTQMEHGKSQ